MTTNNNDGHILYELGDFSFISAHPAWCGISEELEIICESAFTLYTKYSMEAFFKKFPSAFSAPLYMVVTASKGF